MGRPTLVAVACWAYLAAAASLLGALYGWGDRWWCATVLLYSPRWLAALPLVPLLPPALRQGRRALFPLCLAALVVFGPLMGLRLNLPRAPQGGERHLRVLSCNVDNGRFSPEALAALIREMGVDLVALQECPPQLRLPLPPGWHTVHERGLAVLSRLPLRRGVSVPVFDPPGRWPFTCLLSCVVEAPWGELEFCSLQLPTPRYGLMNLLDRRTLLRPSRKGLLLRETGYRARASAEVRRAVDRLTRPVVVAGDFNLPVESAIYRKSWGDLENGFSQAGRGYGYSQRASLRGIPVPVRIDHILTGRGGAVRICQLGAEVGSDHLPLIADISPPAP